MKEYSTEKIRNVAFVSHSGAGKTTVGDAMLFISGGNDRFGRVDDETSVLDHDSEEIRRKTTISTGLAPVEWQAHKINILDTPGYFDFVGEVRSALRVADGALVVVDATGGVEVGTELVWQYTSEYEIPRLLVVNKLDRENTDFQGTLEQVRNVFETNVLPLYLPIGKEANLKGVVDILREVALVPSADGKKVEEQSVPAELADEVASLKEELKEAACDGDDELLEKYLDEGDLTDEEIVRGLRGATLAQRVCLAIPVSASKLVGIHQVMDAIVTYLPSPADVAGAKGVVPGTEDEVQRRADVSEPFSALVFKTTADPYVGKLTIFRVYSGKLESNSTCLNSTKGRTERVGQLFSIKGKEQHPVPYVAEGDIGAVAKLQEKLTGDTLCAQEAPVVF
ncbi:MAG: GTP-binding protein, partial [Bacillota bacterium]